MARDYWDYSKWQEESEDRNVLSDEEVAERLALYEATKNGVVKTADEKLKPAAETAPLKGVQMSLFDTFPELAKATEKKVKKNTPKTTKAPEKTEDELIMESAKPISNVDVFEDLDAAVRFLELAARTNDNIYIEFYGEKLYALLDDRDSCYKKVTGQSYEEYSTNERCERYEDYEDELE